jgi:anti-sigma B factor antagonist
MAAPQGILRVHQDDQVLTFQLEGQATMDYSLPLRRCAEQALACGVTTLRLDLGRCTYMDSTFLGTLFVLKKAILQKGHGSIVLTALSGQCRRLLQQMRLDEYYPIEPAQDIPPEAWTELKGGRGDCSTFKLTVIQAHQELAKIPGPVGEPFREVMRCMNKDLEKQRAEQAPTPLADPRPEAGPR